MDVGRFAVFSLSLHAPVFICTKSSNYIDLSPILSWVLNYSFCICLSIQLLICIGSCKL